MWLGWEGRWHGQEPQKAGWGNRGGVCRGGDPAGAEGRGSVEVGGLSCLMDSREGQV